MRVEVARAALVTALLAGVACSGDDDAGDLRAFCTSVASLDTDLPSRLRDAIVLGETVDVAALDATVEDLRAITDDAPPEIRDDTRRLVGLYDEVIGVLRDLPPGSNPNDVVLALSPVLADPAELTAVEESGQRFDAFVERHCDVDLDRETTTTTAPPVTSRD